MKLLSTTIVFNTLFTLSIFGQLFSQNTISTHHKKNPEKRNIPKALSAPIIDGKQNDACWNNIQWSALDNLWLGDKYEMTDFSGRYKLTWDEEALYLLVHIIDDKLVDKYPDPFKQWWDDDCVEIFIDADNSGGNHLHNYNAFAYHVALDHNVVDLSTEKQPILLNEHIKTAHITQGQTTFWEHKIYLFEEATYNESSNDNTPLKLSLDNEIGFALAYCDNDNSPERENFIGSVFVKGENKNQGYITADIFETIVLKN